MIAVLLPIFGLISFVYGECNVVSKRDWGGLVPIQAEYLAIPLGLVIIQHTATAPCSTDDECVDIVKSIQNVHMDQFGWWDIGPSFLVGGNGKVYEGAGWLHKGAHTYGYNAISIGITFIGNFNENHPSKEALDAAQALLTCGAEKGFITSDYQLVGHRQLIATESPGRNLYAKIRSWPHYLSERTLIKKGNSTIYQKN